MRLLLLLAAALLDAPMTAAFTSVPAFVRFQSAAIAVDKIGCGSSGSSSSSSSALGISSWGKDSSVSRTSDERAKKNPELNPQAYLKPPGPVIPRDFIDGTALVSGLVRTNERTDQSIFHMLNNAETAAFEFDKIVAFVDDAKFAKKRLLSRSARYGGLLDKMEFAEADTPGAFPTLDQINEIRPTNWVAVLDTADDVIDADNIVESVKQIIVTAQESDTVVNLAILLAGATQMDVAASQEILQLLKEGQEDTDFTVVAVGKLEDRPEGVMPYKITEFGTEEGIVPTDAVFSRDEAMRMITECLDLSCGVNKAFTITEVTDVNATEARLIKGLRQAGYLRPQEVDHMIRNGTQAYQKAIEEFYEKNPGWKDGYYETEAWWLQPAFLAAVGENALEKEKEREASSKRARKVSGMAKEWIKNEYFRRSMEGTIENDMTEKEFSDSVWQDAIGRAELTYREMEKRGETTELIETTESTDTTVDTNA